MTLGPSGGRDGWSVVSTTSIWPGWSATSAGGSRRKSMPRVRATFRICEAWLLVGGSTATVSRALSTRCGVVSWEESAGIGPQ